MAERIRPVEAGDKLFDAVLYILMALVLIVVAYPIYFIVVASVSDPNAVNAGQTLLLPKGLNPEGYRALLNDRSIWSGYRNTIFYTFFGTLFSLFLVIPAGYALSRRDMPFRRIVMTYFVVTMFFGGGLIPLYLVAKTLGLINNPLVMVILGAVSVTHIIIVRTFFMTTIPWEFYEAASMDGCSNTRFFLSIVLPVSKAIIAVIALYVAVGQWNSYFWAMIFLSKKEMFPLQLIMRDILVSSQMMVQDLTKNPEELDALRKASESIKYSLIIAASLPVLAIYPFLQKYFVQGVMIGSLKG